MKSPIGRLELGRKSLWDAVGAAGRPDSSIFESAFETLEPRQLLAAPVVTGVTATEGFGRFIQSVRVDNVFVAHVTDADNDPIDHVEFVLNGESVIDNDGADGWTALFDMGHLAGDATLLVTPVDSRAEVGQAHQSAIRAVPAPAWMRDDGSLKGSALHDRSDGYTAVINAGVQSGLVIPSFIPDSIADNVGPGLSGFGAYFSGATNLSMGLSYRVSVPYVGEPTVIGLSMVVQANLIGLPIINESFVLDAGKPTWDLFEVNPNAGGEIDARGLFNGRMELILPNGLMAKGTQHLAMSGDLKLDFDTSTTVSYKTTFYNFGQSFPGLDLSHTVGQKSAPNFVVDCGKPSLPPSMGKFLNKHGNLSLFAKIEFDAGASIAGTFATHYHNDVHSEELTTLHLLGHFRPAGIIGFSGTGDWDNDASGRIGVRFSGGVTIGVDLVDGSLKVPFEIDQLDVDFVIRPPLNNVTISYPLGHLLPPLITKDLLSLSNVSLLFTRQQPDVFTPITPPSSISESAIAASGDSAVLGYITEPSATTPSRVYARLRTGGTYAQPELIDASNTEHFGLSLAYMGDVPVAMWTQNTFTFSELNAKSGAEGVSGREIYWSRRINGAWSAPARLTTDALPDASPSLAFNAAGTAGVAAWVHQENVAAFPDETAAEVYVSRWNGSSWSQPVRVTSDAIRDRAARVAALPDGRFMVSWIKDATDAGSIMYSIVAAGSTDATAPSAAYTAPSGQAVRGIATTPSSDGRVAMAWTRTDASGSDVVESRFYSPMPNTFGTVETVANRRVASGAVSIAEHAGQLAVFFAGLGPVGDTKSAIHVFASYRTLANDGIWTQPVPITQGARNEAAPGSVFLSDGTLLVPYSAPDTFNEGTSLLPAKSGSDLQDPAGAQVAIIGPGPDLAITSLTVDDSGARAGSKVQLTANITNRGRAKATSFVVHVFRFDGVEVASQMLTLDVGKSATYAPLLDATTDQWEFTVRVDPAAGVTDADVASNTRRVSSVYTTPRHADPGATPMGTADASDTHRVVAVSVLGTPIVFEQSATGWKVRALATPTGDEPPAISGAVTYVDPKDGITYVAFPSDAGLMLFARASDGTWGYRNLTSETSAPATPSHLLTQFTSIAGVVVLAGVTTDNRIVAFKQTGAAATGGGPEFAFVDISADLASQGQTTPVFSSLISYVPTWDAWHLSGLDSAGRIQSVWIAPGMTKWRTDDLTAVTGAPAAHGQLAVTLTSWGGINLTGLDASGSVQTTWWVPSFGGVWQVNDLTAQFHGTPLASGNISGYTTPWGGLNYVGIGTDGKVVVYWWAPGLADWVVAPLLPDSVPASDIPTGSLSSSSSNAGTLNVYGTNATGDVLRMSWKPSSEAPWTVENLSRLAT